ncbi:HEAT repeat domain-containing protein [Candidatus Sumerlaeota bacterium]|nr:HEAT repeat domain-containing protein [Candidatus Sumerlaeota bacterium]
MTGRWTPMLRTLASLLNAAGICLFLVWLGQTDFMFGHFTGPPERILAALCLCAAGLAATLAWLVGATRRRRLARSMPERPAEREKTPALVVMMTVAALLLVPPAAITVFVGSAELPNTWQRLRRQHTARLHQRGAKAVPKLVRSLDDSDWQMRSAALHSLHEIGPEAVEALPALMRKLERPQAGGFAQNEAVDTLLAIAAMGEAAKPAIPLLVEIVRGEKGDLLMEDSNIVLRQYAADALGAIGPAAEPALRDLMAGGDAEARRAAAGGVGIQGPAAASSASELVVALADPDMTVRDSAAWALEKMGGGAAPALALGLENPDAEIRREAGRLLRKIGPPAAAALQWSVDEGDAQQRRQAVVALAEMSSINEESIHWLVLESQSEDDSAREAAWQSIEQIGRSANSVFLAMLSNADPAIRRGAAEALGRTGPRSAPDVTKALVRVVGDDDESVSTSALGAIQAFGEKCEPTLRYLLMEGDAPSRVLAARCIGHMGADARGAWVALMMALFKEDENVRRAAEEAFHTLGPDAVERMSSWLTSEHFVMRRGAATALGCIGEPAREAAPLLEEALADPYPIVREAAEEALNRIGVPLPSPLPTPRGTPPAPRAYPARRHR